MNNLCHHKIIYRKIYMSFKNITPEEYDRLIKNKNRIFDLTFPTIKYSENQNKKINAYNKVLNHNLNKYLITNDHQEKLMKTVKYFDKLFENASEEELKSIRKMLVSLSEKNKYKFDTDDDIIKSFKKIFKEKQISYQPYKNKFNTVKDLLDKMESHEKVPKDSFNHFNKELSDKLKYKIPLNKIITNQDGKGLSNTNKIKIDTDLLNKNILSIRYLNGRKLTNKLLKDDYKISKNMVNAIKFNKDIHKLSKNEKKYLL